jgi:hypothetical protein
MLKQWISARAASTAAVVASLVLAGTVASASAAHSNRTQVNANLTGYSKDQCKNGGWRDFKNSDGSLMFKNQGQCIKYFNHGGDEGSGTPVVNHDNLVVAFLNFVAGLFAWFGNVFGGLFGGLV